MSMVFTTGVRSVSMGAAPGVETAPMTCARVWLLFHTCVIIATEAYFLQMVIFGVKLATDVCMRSMGKLVGLQLTVRHLRANFFLHTC